MAWGLPEVAQAGLQELVLPCPCPPAQADRVDKAQMEAVWILAPGALPLLRRQGLVLLLL